MLAWMTLSAASKRGSSENRLLSSRWVSWTLCHAGENDLQVKETMLNIKFNKIMVLLNMFWLQYVFVTSDDSRFALTLLLTSLQVGL